MTLNVPSSTPYIAPEPQSLAKAKGSQQNVKPSGNVASLQSGQDSIKIENKLPQTKAQSSLSLDFEPTAKSNNYYKTFFINGIMTSEADAQNATKTVANYYKTDVELFYNPTEGIVNDILESRDNHNGTLTPIARAYAEKLYVALKDPLRPTDAHICLVAHSQGAAITKDALYQVETMLKKEGLTDTEIVKKMHTFKLESFGGFITPEEIPLGVDYDLFKTTDDSVPQLAEALYKFDKHPLKELLPLGITLGKAGFSNLAQFTYYTGVLSVQQMKPQTIHNLGVLPRHPGLEPLMPENKNSTVGTAVEAMKGDHTLLQTDPRAFDLRKGYFDNSLLKLDVHVISCTYQPSEPGDWSTSFKTMQLNPAQGQKFLTGDRFSFFDGVGGPGRTRQEYYPGLGLR